jgi:hypothetical protein
MGMSHGFIPVCNLHARPSEDRFLGGKITDNNYKKKSHMGHSNSHQLITVMLCATLWQLFDLY